MHIDNANLISKVKEACEIVSGLLSVVQGHEMSLAKSNLEQVALWATQAIIAADAKNGSQPIQGNNNETSQG